MKIGLIFSNFDCEIFPKDLIRYRMKIGQILGQTVLHTFNGQRLI